MDERRIQEAFERMTPSEEAKERMLENILAHSEAQGVGHPARGCWSSRAGCWSGHARHAGDGPASGEASFCAQDRDRGGGLPRPHRGGRNADPSTCGHGRRSYQ